MGKRGRKKKRKSKQMLSEYIQPVPQLADTTKAGQEVTDSWATIDYYFELLWNNKPLKSGQWYDLAACLEQAKAAHHDQAIQKYVDIRLDDRRKKLRIHRQVIRPTAEVVVDI